MWIEIKSNRIESNFMRYGLDECVLVWGGSSSFRLVSMWKHLLLAFLFDISRLCAKQIEKCLRLQFHIKIIIIIIIIVVVVFFGFEILFCQLLSQTLRSMLVCFSSYSSLFLYSQVDSAGIRRGVKKRGIKSSIYELNVATATET